MVMLDIWGMQCTPSLLSFPGRPHFEVSHNPREASKDIFCIKIGSEVYSSAVTGWFMNFCSSCKKPDDQSRKGRPKAMNSETVFWGIRANLPNYIRRESGELSISESIMILHIHDLSRNLCMALDLAVKFKP